MAFAALGPFIVAFCRVTLAALALLLRHGCLGQRGALRLIFWGQTHIASGLASPLNATTPLFTVAVAHALTDDEKMTRAKVAARLAGVAVTIGPDLLARSTGDAWGQLACPGAARSYAFAGIYGWRFRATGIAPLDAAGSPVRRATY